MGYPDPDKNVILVDEQGICVEAGQAGEMLIKSDFLSPGLLGQAQLTQAVFRADPGASGKRFYFSGDLARQRADGALEFVGRKDFQVKIRGYTVQISEVEAVMFDLAG